MKWSARDEGDLVEIVEAGWMAVWPGWDWVAVSLRERGGEIRSAGACKAKYTDIICPNKSPNGA